MTFTITATLILLTVCLSAIRSFVERIAEENAQNSELIDEYYRFAVKFLDASDAEKHKELRGIIVDAGYRMMAGSSLIKGIIRAGARSGEVEIERSEKAKHLFTGLSDDARSAFGHALGVALLVSSKNSLFFGRRYRSVLFLMLSEKREVRNPSQIVVRFEKSGHDVARSHGFFHSLQSQSVQRKARSK